MFSNNLTMMTDLYELTMMQGYFFEGNEDKVVFDVFYRKNPSGSAYAITCGLDQVIDYIKNLSFSYEDIDYLRGLGIFKEDFLSYLAGFHFRRKCRISKGATCKGYRPYHGSTAC